MLSRDILYLPVEELSRRIRARKIRLVEVAESHLAHQEKFGAKMGAVATLRLCQAEFADRHRVYRRRPA